MARPPITPERMLGEADEDRIIYRSDAVHPRYQAYEVDPLVCSRCGRTMKVIAVIERQAVVRQILAHLGLPIRAPGLRAPPDPAGGIPLDRPPCHW